MAGLPIEICLSICRLRTFFADSRGMEKILNGTGFWMQESDSKQFFTTNRHNLDLGYMDSEFKDYELKKIEIELRDFSLDKTRPIPKFFTLSSYFITFSDADVALLSNICFKNEEKLFTHSCLTLDWLADSSFFEKYTGIAQEVSFLGFPHSKFDEEGNFPIARHAVLASWPTRSFKSEFIKPKNITLVSGWSFKGSSGSPVITFARGLRIEANIGYTETVDYCPQKLIGVMSGHLFEDKNLIVDIDQKRTDFLNHSGLSYFTRSTSILDLLKKEI